MRVRGIQTGQRPLISLVRISGINQDASNGDSGGPMFTLQGDKMVITGMCSLGDPMRGETVYASAFQNIRVIVEAVERFTGRPYVPGSHGNSPGDCDVCPQPFGSVTARLHCNFLFHFLSGPSLSNIPRREITRLTTPSLRDQSRFNPRICNRMSLEPVVGRLFRLVTCVCFVKKLSIVNERNFRIIMA
jgi:hypothetical protein